MLVFGAKEGVAEGEAGVTSHRMWPDGCTGWTDTLVTFFSSSGPYTSPPSCPWNLRSFAPAFEISEVAGSHLHLGKRDRMFMALPVKPVNTL